MTPEIRFLIARQEGVCRVCRLPLDTAAAAVVRWQRGRRVPFNRVAVCRRPCAEAVDENGAAEIARMVQASDERAERGALLARRRRA